MADRNGSFSQSNGPLIGSDRPEARPPIAPVEGDAPRPSWSVMIPSYDADPPMLEQALRSVLDQDPGPDRMQVAVVEDASPGAERSEGLVRRLAPGRVEFHRNEANLGLAGNWNRCVERARGRWVHVLHQDDRVLPGFYEALGRADRERPDAGAAFCQHLTVDAAGRWTRLSPLERTEPGIVDDWLGRIAREQRLQCVSIVVRREVYERLGGFRTDLRMALDWEMWARIAAHYPVWYEPTVLAHYRYYEGSETSRLRRSDLIVADVERAMEVMRAELPPPYRDRVGEMMASWLIEETMPVVDSLMHAGDYKGGLARLRIAARNCRPPWHFWPTLAAYHQWALKIAARRALGLGRGRGPETPAGVEEAGR